MTDIVVLAERLEAHSEHAEFPRSFKRKGKKEEALREISSNVVSSRRLRQSLLDTCSSLIKTMCGFLTLLGVERVVSRFPVRMDVKQVEKSKEIVQEQ